VFTYSSGDIVAKTSGLSDVVAAHRMPRDKSDADDANGRSLEVTSPGSDVYSSITLTPPPVAVSSQLTSPSSRQSDVHAAAAGHTVEVPIIGRLPRPYVLPSHSIRDCLKACLSRGEILTPGQRTELLEAIYLDVTKYTLYVYIVSFSAVVGPQCIMHALWAVLTRCICLSLCSKSALWSDAVTVQFRMDLSLWLGSPA